MQILATPLTASRSLLFIKQHKEKEQLQLRIQQMANDQSETAAQLSEGKEHLKAALDRAEVEKQEMKQQVQAAQASYEAMLAQTGELRSRLAATETANNELREQMHILQQKLLSHAQSLKGDNEQRDEVEKRARTAETQLAAAKQKLKGLQYVVHEQEEKVGAFVVVLLVRSSLHVWTHRLRTDADNARGDCPRRSNLQAAAGGSVRHATQTHSQQRRAQGDDG